MFDTPPSSLKLAAILLPKQHIFLLSHMRAYSSLIGHIIGSNPAVCGYYEMHIGYHSWRSLIRQKLLYFQQDDPKPGFLYMFDKILHNEHNVSRSVLNNRRAKTIFCLRRPQEAIPSILKLYQEVDPLHEFNFESNVSSYYIQRLTTLAEIAASLETDFFYLDAESIKYDSNECLRSLGDWLQLEVPLSPNYKIQKNTAKERLGDPSERLKAGRITDDRSEYQNFQQDAELLNRAFCKYNTVRKALIRASAQHCVTK